MSVLKQGSSGPEVTALQQKLKDLGFDPKGVDGGFGKDTKAAVIAFQQDRGLKVDGEAGPDTLAALQLGETTDNGGAPAASAIPNVTVKIVSKMFPATNVSNIET